MGIIAQWGKGKSSYINLLMNEVKKHGDIIIRFNPRGSKSAANIQEDFFDAFATELSKYYAGFGFLLGRYTKHLGLLGQYEWTRPLESLLTLLLPEKDLKAINDVIATIGRRVYVVIDDLDRLTGEEILEVLKLVDRNASFNNVVFVMAYDKEYINNVLRKHLDHGLDHSFIDKYTTWEVTIPEVDGGVLKSAMARYLKLHMSELSNQELQRMLRGWSSVSDIVAGYLESVRHLKRYLNLMISKYREVYDKVNLADFFMLSLLRYRHLNIYNDLAWGMYISFGISKDTNIRCYHIPIVERNKISEKLPHDASFLLCEMFPSEFGVDAPQEFEEKKSICSEKYFPYYFRNVEDKTVGR